MTKHHLSLEHLLRGRVLPLPSRGFEGRIIAAARLLPQQPMPDVAGIIPALFRDFGIPMPLFVCAALLACGFFIGLAAPLDGSVAFASAGAFHSASL